jgi:hypothetical protein
MGGRVQDYTLIAMSMNPKKPRTPCLVCEKEPFRPSYKYCSNACQWEYMYRSFIKDWKSGKRSGLQTIGVVTPRVKRYLREAQGNKCCLCGWAVKHPVTGVIPLVADHIDGNWRNNTESNLRLLCPNCDALTPTHGNLNRGHGRPNRAVSKRAVEARMLAQKEK